MFTVTLKLTEEQAIVLWDALADARNLASDRCDSATETELAYMMALTHMMALVDAATDDDR